MADYAIGDVQGCYEPLQRLLDKIHFNERQDRLWFVGDLVSRGPDSLNVLRFIHSLPVKPKITLGNHDLHLLALIFTNRPRSSEDHSLSEILSAPDKEILGHWLRKQNLLCHAPALNVVMCHAGIAPVWTLQKAINLALELEAVLSGDSFADFLNGMYGNEPSAWSDELIGIDRLKAITNYFTRMRFCREDGSLELKYKGTLAKAPANLYPWYATPGRNELEPDVIFGHWAALEGACPSPKIYALDTGCVWGGRLTALRLQDRNKFSVPSRLN